jgi:glycosyltransferase involved in cell wall biosynthesis
MRASSPIKERTLVPKTIDASQGSSGYRPKAASCSTPKDAEPATDALRRPRVGIWSELPPGSRWANEGIQRIIGFFIEGAAAARSYYLVVCVPTGMAETVREDLRELHAVEFENWEVVEPPEGFSINFSDAAQRLAGELGVSQEGARQAIFANQHVDVEAWIISFPHFTGALLLDAPRATLLPDAIPFDFPVGWGDAFWRASEGWPLWRKSAGLALRLSDSIVAHSEHVGQRHGVELLSCDPERIVINPHPPPDLSPLLPPIGRQGPGQASRAYAGLLLRDHARERGWSYLQDFNFEEAPYVVVSTQDRPTKNLIAAADAVRMLNRDRQLNLKMLTTARIQFGADWTLLPQMIQDERMEGDVVSLHDLPRRQHAALYHCAALTIHPSFYEGIVGTLTFFESVSLHTPCLMARGPHVEELLKIEPSLEPWVFDPYDHQELSEMILKALAQRGPLLELQREVFKRMSRRGWDVAADVYCQAALRPQKLDGLRRLASQP